MSLAPGVTKAGEGLDNIAWNILGQTYVPKQVCESSFAWHATFPPGTFVPPHIHPTQEEFISVSNGRFDLLLDGHPASAGPGDFIRLPRAISHGIFNKTQSDVTCLFWVSPTRHLWDLFQAIHNVADPAEVVRLAHEAGALAFIDAVHYAPHGSIDVRALDCDFLACSPYKFFGPHMGCIYGKRELLLRFRPYKVRPAPAYLPDRWESGTQIHEGLAGVTAAVDYLADLGRHSNPNATGNRRAALESKRGRGRPPVHATIAANA